MRNGANKGEVDAEDSVLCAVGLKEGIHVMYIPLAMVKVSTLSFLWHDHSLMPVHSGDQDERLHGLPISPSSDFSCSLLPCTYYHTISNLSSHSDSALAVQSCIFTFMLSPPLRNV